MHGAASMNIAAILLALCSAPLVTHALTSITSSNIKAAAKLWVSDEAQAKAKYGDIADWDTSSVTDMEGIFERETEFNADLSKWKVSDVTSLQGWSPPSFTVLFFVHMADVLIPAAFDKGSQFNADISNGTLETSATWKAVSLKSCASRDCNANIDFPPDAAFRGASEFNADLSKWNVVKFEIMYFSKSSSANYGSCYLKRNDKC